MRTFIKNATIVNESRQFVGSILIEEDRIAGIFEHSMAPQGPFDEQVDASGCFVFPGVIDEHVHFREPGLTAKADIESESRAAAYGGVTSFFDMPNTLPQTTTLEALDEKFALAAEKSHVNYSFFYGATNQNTDTFDQLDEHRIPGIKLFMGSSTGNMLVDRREALEKIFSSSRLPIMAHCEDTGIINRNMARVKAEFGDDPVIGFHPVIRSEEACYESTRLAVELASKYGTRLHVAHLTTQKELSLFETCEQPARGKLRDSETESEQSICYIPPRPAPLPKITAEAVIAHLFFTDCDYSRLGTRIKCNPAIKRPTDREALRKALMDGRIATVGTDHAPHLLKDKEGGCASAASGMPMIQFSLVAMLELVDKGVLTLECLTDVMCHRPAQLFEMRERGYLRQGYKADVVVVRPNSPWTVTPDIIQSKCQWSPMEGHTFNWRVEHTFCNGQHIYNKGVFDEKSRGEAITFR